MCQFACPADRIAYGFEFMVHREKVFAIDPNDPLMCHMNGRWCYEVAKLSWIERQLAQTFLRATPPKATFEQALEGFMKAKEFKEDSVINSHWIAKTHFALKNYAEAKEWINKGLAFEPKDDEELFEREEMVELQRKIMKYI